MGMSQGHPYDELGHHKSLSEDHWGARLMAQSISEGQEGKWREEEREKHQSTAKGCP